jgi:hypothetical protein
MSAKNKKAPAVDLSTAHSIFIGWVDLNPSAYASLSYKSKDVWIAAINKANADFQQQCKSKYLADHTVSGAKSKEDENAAGNDLYIRFDDVIFDSSYILHISAHVIDVKENKEVATITNARYRGRLCALEGCVTKELDALSADLQAAIEPNAKGK